MTVYIVTMVSGEKLITEVKGIYEDPDNKKRLGFAFTRPFLLEVEKFNNENISVKFSPWNPFTNDIVFQIPDEMVLSINTPDPHVLAIYNEKMEKLNEAEIQLKDETDIPLVAEVV